MLLQLSGLMLSAYLYLNYLQKLTKLSTKNPEREVVRGFDIYDVDSLFCNHELLNHHFFL